MNLIRFTVRAAVVIAIASSISSAASAAVYPPSRQLQAQIISDFKGSPATLLQQYPDGGPQLISRVRDLGASDPTTVPGLIELLKNPATSKDQLRAIVAGLAQVARMAAQTDQAFANEIQAAVAGTNNPDVIAAYQAATGDVAIAAAGGAGGGGSGGGGPTTGFGFAFGGSGSGAQSFGGLHYPNSVTTYTGSVTPSTAYPAVSPTQ
ncbi:hypothetical protein [Bradyrhizobium sp. RP6]|uniref:hypothetical protein n=1 Tax=Bradyrhizobium sp. RP6 TaxID=2489596 RepID=UPI000F52B53B|nr:hypothetical protein [Bradyrhizobium sp. RP6]RQH11520.1 hypothetical protein EHH60_20025 [Bradyrhizobium sp. RP6]